MQLFTENHSVALPRTAGDLVQEAGYSQVLASDSTALPGALEVYLIRAAELDQVRRVGLRLPWHFYYAQPVVIWYRYRGRRHADRCRNSQTADYPQLFGR